MLEPIRVDLAYPRVDGNPSQIIVNLIDVRAANSIAISYDFARDGWSISSDMSDPDHPEMPEAEPVEVAFVSAWPQATTDTSAQHERVTVPRPHVPFGPLGVPEALADAEYLDHAARSIASGYAAGGYNVTNTVVKLLHDTASALRADHADGSAP